MKCPHCNKEHSDDTKICPNTGKEMELLACQNRECPDFGKKIWPADSKYCPTCGRPLIFDEAMRKLFPVYDIVLGNMTSEEIKNRASKYNPTPKYYTRGGSIVSIEDFDFKKCENGKTPNEIIAYNGCTFPDNWVALGFSWTLSSYECISLLEDIGFTIRDFDEENNTIYAISEGGYLVFVFKFHWRTKALDEISLKYLQTPNCDIEHIMNLFFPICGITLGETTIEEAREIPEDEWCREGKYDLFEVNDHFVDTEFGEFWPNDNGLLECMELNTYDEIPEEWAELGISWESSQDELIDIFESIGSFCTDKSEYSNGDGDVWATSCDDHLCFNFEFSDGKISEIRVTWKP